MVWFKLVLLWFWQTPCPADLIDLQHVAPEVQVVMPYATQANVAGVALYPVQRCLLRREVAARLQAVQQALQKSDKQLTLLVWDCYRPIAAQRRLYKAVVGTKRAGYVTNPDGPRAAVHTYGAAVDLTIWHKGQQAPLPMGTGYDFFGPLAEPRRESTLLQQGLLQGEHLVNRRLLRRLMLEIGRFRSIPNEWWHFDAWQGQALRQRYEPLDIPLDCQIAPVQAD